MINIQADYFSLIPASHVYLYIKQYSFIACNYMLVFTLHFQDQRNFQVKTVSVQS